MTDIVADIGGTNLRMATVVDGKTLGERKTVRMERGTDVANELAQFAQDLHAEAVGKVIAAGAGPKRGRKINLTNGGQVLSEPLIAKVTGAKKVQVINDFEAAARSLETVSDQDVMTIGTGDKLRNGNRVAIGPGTGLGVGALVWSGSGYTVVPGEGGHVTALPLHTNEIPVFLSLHDLWPDTVVGDTLGLEAEAFVSGTGLPLLYQAHGGKAGLGAADIFALAASGDKKAVETREMFKRHLAVLAGNLAVTFKATGGVFLVGGVAQSNPDLFDAAFFEAFAQGGRFTNLRENCGVYLVTNPDYGLIGCMNAMTAMA